MENKCGDDNMDESNNEADESFISISLKEELEKCSNYFALDDNSNMNIEKCDPLFQINNSDISDQAIPYIPESSSISLSKPSEDCIQSKNFPQNVFQISKESIPCIPKEHQEEGLSELNVTVYDQTEFESEVMGQVDKALKFQEEQKQKEELQRELKSVSDDIRFVNQRLNHIEKAFSMAPKDTESLTKVAKREISSIQKEKENKIKHLKKLEAKKRALMACMLGNTEEINNSLQANLKAEEEMDSETLYHLQKAFAPQETEEERLIRTGQMTPFGTKISKQQKTARKIIIPQNELTDFDKFLLDQAKEHQNKKIEKPSHKLSQPSTSKSLPSLSKSSEEANTNNLTDIQAISNKISKSKPKIKLGSKHALGFSKKRNPNRGLVKNYKSDSDISDFEINSDDDYVPDTKDYLLDENLSDFNEDDLDQDKIKISKKRKKNKNFENAESCQIKSPKKIKKIADDGDQKSYIKRIKIFQKSKLIEKHKKILESEDGIVESDEESATEFEGEYRIPNSIWNKLYRYQQTGVRWLWELHQQNCGGIIGDEMGLGKTIQVIAFLVGLKFSQLETDGDNFKGLGPVMLVCPATIMHQWVKEFHTWWPPFRVGILHESGSFTGKKEALVQIINKSHGILITSYVGVVLHQTSLLNHEWHYVILDEGHKIRNPDAQATLVVKQFRTSHRIILSGSPVQNNLKELWSLFDFIFPGKLGTLPVFMQQFAVPIVQGGYANASQVQVQTAYKCATVLRDTIKPYLLRRMKSDVKMSLNLPNKNEQVLFCQLTPEQINLYKGYINSKEVNSILNAKLQIFVGLINLRKICNHPDLFDGGPKIFKDTDISNLSEDMHYGYYKRSGKMIVIESLLKLWHKQGHRVLLFTQSRQMMVILERFIKSRNYSFMKMDGSTSISSRQPAIARFNSDSNIFIFLLTTRVGGIGVNLTGADRIIIFDPDWNPSTDAQAKERAWRIGQDKQVTIYRLLTAGTIEEKIYQRQIFKQFVTNRVLKDPRQKRFFKSNDLYELFAFNEVGKEGTETSAIFAGTGSEVKPTKKYTSHKKYNKFEKDPAIPLGKTDDVSKLFTPEKLDQMKQLAKKLSMKLSEKIVNESKSDKFSDQINSDSKNENSCDITDKESSFSKSYNLSENTNSNKIQKKVTKKRSKKRKHIVVDGEKIDYLVKSDIYKPPQENEQEKNAKHDDYVLSKLLKKSGVHTALKHDVIVEASDPDYALVEGEANKVAKEAIKALRESRRMCYRAETGIPTWTGEHGGKKLKFGSKKKLPTSNVSSNESNLPGPSQTIINSPSKPFGKKLIFDGKKDTTSALSSEDLISAINQRKHVFGSDVKSDESDNENSMGPSSTEHKPTKNDELLVEIRNFIAFGASVDGQATTQELVETFKDKLPIHQTAIFKAMLSKICDFSRTSSGDGLWYLKGEFR